MTIDKDAGKISAGQRLFGLVFTLVLPLSVLLLSCLLLSGCGKKESAEKLFRDAENTTGFRCTVSAELVVRGKSNDRPSRFSGTIEKVPGVLFLRGSSMQGGREVAGRQVFYRESPDKEGFLELYSYRMLDDVWNLEIVSQRLLGLPEFLKEAEEVSLKPPGKNDEYLEVNCFFPAGTVNDCFKLTSCGMTFLTLYMFMPEDARYQATIVFRRDTGVIRSMEFIAPEGLIVQGKEIASCRFFLNMTDTNLTELEAPVEF